MLSENQKRIKSESKRKIFAWSLYTMAIMGSLLFLLMTSHNHYRDLVITSQQENILNIVTTVSRQLERHFKAQDDYFKTLAQAFNRPEDLVLRQTLNQVYAIDPARYSDLAVYDSDMALIYSVRGREGKLTIEPAEKPQYFIDTSHEQDIHMVYPLFSGLKVVGYLSVSFDSDEMYKTYIASYRLHQTGYISLKDQYGRLFLHPSGSNIGVEVVEARSSEFPEYDWSELDAIVQDQLLGNTGVGVYHSVWPGDGTRIKKINAYTPCYFGDAFMILNFSIDYEETLYSFQGITKATSLIALLIGAMSLFMIGYLFFVEVKKSELALEALYFEELKEKNALILHQSKHASMGELIATIAHQFKQPLNALKLSLYNLEDSIDLDRCHEANDIATLLKANHRYVDTLSQTINDFRTFFKPQTEVANFDVKEAIEFAIELNRERINLHSIRVEVAQKSPIALVGEGNILSQIMLNLINNAIDAVKSNDGERWIKVIVEKKEEDVSIYVYDNGGGIPQNILNDLFKPYVSTKGTHGTGLGLYISRYVLIEKFKGNLAIHNTDEGVCICVTIPSIPHN